MSRPDEVRAWRRQLLTAAALCAVAVATACGGDGDDGDGQTRATDPVAPADWAREVCAGFGEWTTGIEEGAVAVPGALGAAPGLPQARDALLGFVGAVVDQTDALRAAVEGAGTPDVDDGAAIAEALDGALVTAAEEFEAARERAEALPPDDPTGFQAGLDRVREAIRGGTAAARGAVDDVVTRFEAPRFDEVLRAEPACQALTAHPVGARVAFGAGS